MFITAPMTPNTYVLVSMDGTEVAAAYRLSVKDAVRAQLQGTPFESWYSLNLDEQDAILERLS